MNTMKLIDHGTKKTSHELGVVSLKVYDSKEKTDLLLLTSINDGGIIKTFSPGAELLVERCEIGEGGEVLKLDLAGSLKNTTDQLLQLDTDIKLRYKAFDNDKHLLELETSYKLTKQNDEIYITYETNKIGIQSDSEEDKVLASILEDLGKKNFLLQHSSGFIIAEQDGKIKVKKLNTDDIGRDYLVFWNIRCYDNLRTDVVTFCFISGGRWAGAAEAPPTKSIGVNKDDEIDFKAFNSDIEKQKNTGIFTKPFDQMFELTFIGAKLDNDDLHVLLRCVNSREKCLTISEDTLEPDFVKPEGEDIFHDIKVKFLLSPPSAPDHYIKDMLHA